MEQVREIYRTANGKKHSMNEATLDMLSLKEKNEFFSSMLSALEEMNPPTTELREYLRSLRLSHGELPDVYFEVLKTFLSKAETAEDYLRYLPDLYKFKYGSRLKNIDRTKQVMLETIDNLPEKKLTLENLQRLRNAGSSAYRDFSYTILPNSLYPFAKKPEILLQLMKDEFYS